MAVITSTLKALLGWRVDPLSAALRAYRERCRPYAVPGYAESVQRIKRYADKHKGERCVIIGNGPSLKQMDLSFLRNEISFGLNRIYMLSQETDIPITYHTCVNPLVLEQFGADIAKFPPPKFISVQGYPHVEADENLMFLASGADLGFSTDVSREVNEGYTVTYVAMQLAFYMGFEEVVLIGVDHSFQSKGEPNEEAVMERDDPNHFDGKYFGPGTRWNLPDLEMSETAYRIGKAAFERAGRRVLDATVNGCLQVFPKVDYREYFEQGCKGNCGKPLSPPGAGE